MNALDVLSNKDLFENIQTFAYGYERIVLDFSARFEHKYRLPRLIEEALHEAKWSLADKLYAHYQLGSYTYFYASSWSDIYTHYPHPAYSYLSTCEWLHTSMGDKFKYWREYMDIAAGMGNLELVKFMHYNRPEGCSSFAMDKAAMMGDLDMVKFLHDHRMEGCSTKAIDYAAANGHLEVIKFLHDHRMEGCSTNVIDYAASNGHLEVIKFFYENRSERGTTRSMMHAVHHGHMDVYEFLCSN